MNKQYSPTPWVAFGRDIEDANENHIVTTYAISASDPASASANAEFIVRACNAHDQLVASLRAVLLEIGDYGRPSVRADARKALAAAGAA